MDETFCSFMAIYSKGKRLSFATIAISSKEQHVIQFYAGALCVSTTYLSRIIREATQKTVYYYIAEKIFTSARHLLACTDDTMADIANKMNFSDQSAFGKFFKAKAGMSPAQYRKLLGNCVKGNPPEFLSYSVNKPNPHR
ncbi:MAG TPA: helix-turn-helix domain-containing protein [Candidatus Coprenecus stercoravium]|uniref:Helix-turn-helix domain-containing protein n=1 Tax=Candidatus Coprenecus stercoravium TaxID=2840735 RepID=A0A9D2K8L9_9BACT|nr:helix-turn-helix domain-containing protein [Candidatus Coprenecus stercoravium]